MAQCTSKTLAGKRCRKQAQAGRKTCTSHSKGRSAGRRMSDTAPHVAIGTLLVLSKKAKGEMKRRLTSIVRDIRSYLLAMGPYPEELGL
jgi:hypothetical protein